MCWIFVIFFPLPLPCEVFKWQLGRMTWSPLDCVFPLFICFFLFTFCPFIANPLVARQSFVTWPCPWHRLVFVLQPSVFLGDFFLDKISCEALTDRMDISSLIHMFFMTVHVKSWKSGPCAAKLFFWLEGGLEVNDFLLSICSLQIKKTEQGSLAKKRP